MNILNTTKTFALGAAAWGMVAGASIAQGRGNGNAFGLGNGNGNGNAFGHGKNKFAAVPEIDAGSGLLAVAVVISALLLVRELRRRAHS